jgi:hypothetical protein
VALYYFHRSAASDAYPPPWFTAATASSIESATHVVVSDALYARFLAPPPLAATTRTGRRLGEFIAEQQAAAHAAAAAAASSDAAPPTLMAPPPTPPPDDARELRTRVKKKPSLVVVSVSQLDAWLRPPEPVAAGPVEMIVRDLRAPTPDNPRPYEPLRKEFPDGLLAADLTRRDGTSPFAPAHHHHHQHQHQHHNTNQQQQQNQAPPPPPTGKRSARHQPQPPPQPQPQARPPPPPRVWSARQTLEPTPVGLAKPGACECCNAKYSDYVTHIYSAAHQRFVTNPSNFGSLDALIAFANSASDSSTASIAERTAKRRRRGASFIG